MDKKLNIPSVQEAMERVGLNPATIAGELEVSRAAVSKWLAGSSFPRPNKLLKLALLLGLKLNDLVEKTSNSDEPIVAFRKRGATKTTAEHIAHAKEIGYLLKPLVPYLPFDQFKKPSTLKHPSTDYSYLQKLAIQVRQEMFVSQSDVLDFGHIIKGFADKQVVLVPVLWGKKDKHNNAIHIFLPDSMTTWVFLNLDVEIHDFKFWMAHELGHVLAPELSDDTGEDFADDFAGALLFPEVLAKEAHRVISHSRGEGKQINQIIKIAEEHLISPITVYSEVNKYAVHHSKKAIALGNNLYGTAKNLSKKYKIVSHSIFAGEKPAAKDYIQFAHNFDSPFFEVLVKYLKKENKEAGYISSVLDIPLHDAREIFTTLL